MTTGGKVWFSASVVFFAILLGLISWFLHEFTGYRAGMAAFKSGYAREHARNYSGAIADFDLALSKPIGDYWRAYSFHNRAYCLEQMRRRSEAIRDYSETLSIMPENTAARASRGILYEEMGQKDLALTDFRQALNTNRNLGNVWYHLACADLRQGTYKRADKEFREAIRCMPEYEPAYLGAARASIDLQDWDEGLANIETAIRLNPRDAEAYSTRGLLHRRRKQYDKAIADLTTAIQLRPGNPHYFLARATAYTAQSRREEELADLTEALRLDPGNEAALYRRGRVYRVMKDFPKAIADFSELIKVTQSAAAYNERARTYFRSGEFARALADYQQAAIAPIGKLKSEAKPLAWLLATCPDPQYRNGTQAIPLALKDCERTRWHSSNQIDTLAAACAEAGRFDEAVRYQEQAIALHDEDAEGEEKLQQRLELYQKHQPYREESGK